METFNQLRHVLRQGIYNLSSSALEHVDCVSSYLPTTMPSAFSSLRSMAKVALGSAQLALLSSGNTVSGGSPDSCPNPQLSCHNTTAQANTCCFNAPGGQLLQTQFWDSNPATGPADHWTVHGLWSVSERLSFPSAWSRLTDPGLTTVTALSISTVIRVASIPTSLPFCNLMVQPTFWIIWIPIGKTKRGMMSLSGSMNGASMAPV